VRLLVAVGFVMWGLIACCWNGDFTTGVILLVGGNIIAAINALIDEITKLRGVEEASDDGDERAGF